jgi:hypothetical protein
MIRDERMMRTTKMRRYATTTLLASSFAALILMSATTRAGDRLLGTGGVMEIEGSAGGGLTPWALIAGLGTDQQFGASAFCTRVRPQDFRLDSCGAAVGVDNRLELSFAKQSFNLGATVPGQNIDQTIVGAKWRLFGDAVIDQDRWWPQVATGIQWKHNDNFDLVPRALGARHAQGADFYVAATKVWLAGPFGHSWIVDLTLRATEANQFGILGFGGDLGGYHLMPEGSLGTFLLDNLMLGVEYRQKPDNLSAFRENSADDLFLAAFPCKYLSLTVAYLNLGNIANRPDQHGLYVSLQASW